ncbi:DUF2793 domain-containing protein [Falsirhodobacter sp. 20TX0035]|uniref:DUF2793 domain-containing protein n=1 Tax=Falsirhodobacter sp. 20TX0035 TaxID=3022019 RepID=UPI00232F6D0C|nr:DUF2793 domain-containing protein [Falsirhodobacter sp. 20TX0035]MDB6452704.1 DUF2793 domain-containing protein [Falsirhodobacter sp. 20TX0035]
MSDSSLVLSLPLIQPQQAQKHITHNEALARLDLLVQLAVATQGGTQAPAAVPGDRHIVGAGASGLWAGHDHEVALMTETGWSFEAPKPGWQAFVLDQSRALVWSGTVWKAAADSRPVVERLGVGTTPDAGNPLAVAGAATLLTHAGGSHRLKVNKAATAETASLLFQSNWSGRAEMGLAGEDAFSLKVSPDGSTFRTALTANPATGAVTLPAGLVMEGAVTGKGVMQGATDTTDGRLMTTGAFGLGRAKGKGVAQASAAAVPGAGLYSMAAAADPARRGEERALLAIATEAQPAAFLSWAMAGSVARPLFGGVDGAGTLRWDAALTRETAVGTVAAQPDAASPAVLETGGTATSRYLRLADGTQICWGRFSLSAVAVNIEFAGGFRSAGQSVSFAKPFSDTPTLTTGCADLGVSDALSGGNGSVGVAGFATYLWRATTSASARLAGSYVAIGRWF